MTRPLHDAPSHPAVLYLPGLGCTSQDRPLAEPQGTDIELLHAVARAGYVTMRVEKSGLGDSDGKPCSELDFHEELAGYRAGLEALLAYDFVDPGRVFLFGYSMGGVMAPFLASDEAVLGVAVYGTIFENFLGYMSQNIRRQADRNGLRGERAILREQAYWTRLLEDHMTPGEVAERHPDLARSAPPGTDDTHLYGRHVSFFHQLQALSLEDAWAEASSDVLAIHGEYDWISASDDHAAIAEVVRVAGGSGRYVQLPGLDHTFTRHDSLEDSYRDYPNGERTSAAADTLLEWLRGGVARLSRPNVRDPPPGRCASAP